MNRGWVSILALLFCTTGLAQSEDLQQMLDAETVFGRTVIEKGVKPAFLEILADDAIIFRPNSTNGKEFWNTQKDSAARLFRNPTYTDIAANGLLGYTMGAWELYPNGKPDSLTQFGHYVTVWGKAPGGKFRAILDIGITHDQLSSTEANLVRPTFITRDLNKQGWSAADASMNFLRMGMTGKALGGAYEKFADDDVRVLIEREPPIIGKKNVVAATKRYTSLSFPEKVALFESGDMAYVWNPCQFASSSEGTEQGNCLHIWKLRNEQWLIVVGVFARVTNNTPPELKVRHKKKASS